MRAAAALLTAALVVMSSGQAGADQGASGPAPHVDLRIEVAASSRDDAPKLTGSIRCRPTGGTWRARREVCDRLRTTSGRAALGPLGAESRDLRSITSQPLRVSGTVAGRRVDLAFAARGSSTRAARYRAVVRLLGVVEVRRAQRRARRG